MKKIFIFPLKRTIFFSSRGFVLQDNLFNNTFLRKLFFLLAVILLTTGSIFAQGIIRGVVADSISGDPLFGANVYFLGTSIGTATGNKGDYRITNIPMGNYQLKVSYVGYKAKIFSVNVNSNRTIDFDIKLTADVVQGKEVIVSAQAEGQAAAINQQITSDVAINVVSADRIRELPDANAAESVGRLPGISLIRNAGEASQVVIRGLAPKYNEITVNGVTIPSTGSDDRSVDLSMVSSEMLSGIEVYKSITPDMDAEAVGGVVNLRIKKAPKESQIWLKVAPGYSQLKSDWGNIQTAGEFDDRLFNDKLGLVITGNYQRINRGSEQYGASFHVAGPADPTTGIVPIAGSNLSIRSGNETRKRWGASVSLDYSFDNGTIWWTNFYSSTLRNPFSVQKQYAPPNISYNVTSQQITENGLSSSLNGEFNLGVVNMDWALSRYNVENKSNYNLAMNLLQGSAFNKQLNPDNVVTYVPASINDMGLTTLNQMSFTPNVTTQTNYTAQYNAKIHMTFSDFVTGSIKTGIKYTNATKNYNTSQISETHYGLSVNYTNEAQAFVPYTLLLNANGIITAQNFISSTNSINILDGQFDLSPIFDQNTIEQFYTYIKPSLPFVPGQLAGLYSLKETKTAGYLMGELDIGQLINIIPGVRLEYFDNWYQAYKTGTYSDLTSVPTVAMDTTHFRINTYWFPHLHIKIKPMAWLNVMLSAYRSISLPNYDWVSPWVSLNLGDATINRGNPDLLDTKVSNYNITLNIFDNTFGLFSVSGFYKDLRDISYAQVTQLFDPAEIQRLQIPFQEKGYVMHSYSNTDRAQVRGFELELQTRLNLLPGVPDFLRGIVINANFTRLWSKTYFPFYNFQATPIPGTRPIRYTYNQTVYNREGPMPGQANEIANISVGYDIGGLSTRVSLLYQGPSISSVGLSGLSDTWNNSFWRWDFAFKYRFSQLISADFNLVNISNQPDRAFFGSQEYMTNESYYGLNGNLGIEINL